MPKPTYPAASISIRNATIRQLSQVQRHLKESTIILDKIKLVYEERFPVIGEGCRCCIEGLTMYETIIDSMRDTI